MKKKTEEGSKSLAAAYTNGLKTVVVFVGGIFLFRAVNELYDRYLASDIKPLPPGRHR